jgi:hypothetical protein
MTQHRATWPLEGDHRCQAAGARPAAAFLTYKEGVDAFRLTDRLSDGDRATLMGGTLQKVYGWAPSPPGR